MKRPSETVASFFKGRSEIRLLQELDEELRGEDDHDERDGIGRRVSGGDVVGLGGVDERAERRGGGHAAGERTKVVEHAELNDVARDEVSEDHRDKGHDRAVDEEDEALFLDDFDKTVSAGDACANEEHNESEFAERLEEISGKLHADLSEMTKMTEDQAHEERAAGVAQGEASAAGKRN